MKNTILIILLAALAYNISADNLTYTGNQTICFINNTANQTCLTSGEVFDFNPADPYVVVLKAPTKTLNLANFYVILEDNIWTIALTLVIITLPLLVAFYFML